VPLQAGIVRIGDNAGGRYSSGLILQMGEYKRPCGPCSEIFFDHSRPDVAGGPRKPDEDGAATFRKIWERGALSLQY